MYRDRRVALVIPAYNEERLIGKTLAAVPPLFDRVYVVDDCSPDGQNAVIERSAQSDSRVRLLKHKENQGPGGAIITGYLESAREGFDYTVVIGGDHQMDLAQVGRFLDPLVDGRCDYTKGNRFLLKELAETMRRMPRIRLFGNWVITLLTKISSGYFKVMDVVDGYTAITRDAIETINWDIAWRGYGYPMDFLVRLNAYGFRVVDVARTAIYTPGERQSQIKGFRYALRVSPMLIRDFFWRLRFKYMYRDFHPLVFFYLMGIPLVAIGFGTGGYLIWDKLFSDGVAVTGPKAILVALTMLTGFQFLLFAMLFDMQEND
ncbi:MAG: glycosyltransferase family 2 protein [Bdellovibrionales bacterium]|nr:glycosyltransferase family 2 protein [Bdellovibrionales bacterium]